MRKRDWLGLLWTVFMVGVIVGLLVGVFVERAEGQAHCYPSKVTCTNCVGTLTEAEKRKRTVADHATVGSEADRET